MVEVIDGVLTKYEGTEDVLVLDEAITEIKPLIFRHADNLRVIDLSKTKVENLLTKTFFECKNVYKIILPETLKVISFQVFSNCMNLEEITIPESVDTIMAGSFEECMSLTRIEIPSKVLKIEMNLFKNCSKLEYVYLSDGLVEIGESAFENCINLNNITLPKTLKKLDMFAFRNCRNLSGIVIPKTIRMVPRGCFYSCVRLSMVILPAEIQKLDDWSFRECTALDKMDIPKTCKVSPCAFLDSMTPNEPKFTEKVRKPKENAHCYIATCVYGTYDTAPLFVLRRYRDYHLKQSWHGRLFVKFYYATAPTVIKLFGRFKWFNKFFRKVLDKKVDRLKKKGYFDGYYEDI